MPLPIQLAHQLALKLSDVRKSGQLPYLRPDGKSQVTVEYRDGRPFRVDAVVISSQHAPEVENDQLRSEIREHVIKSTCPGDLMDDNTKYHINPTGRFVPAVRRATPADRPQDHRRHLRRLCAARRRRLLGKDPTKVDRSRAYMARYIAKNIVAAGLADKCEFSSPTPSASPSRFRFTSTHAARPHQRSTDFRSRAPAFPADAEGNHFRTRSASSGLQSHRAYGHFGRTGDGFTWERTTRRSACAPLPGLISLAQPYTAGTDESQSSLRAL
jgi:S-adenosylmethionine synthetase